MNYIKYIINYLSVVFLLFQSVEIVAQNNKSIGTRITTELVESELGSTAILDLDSSDRGFLMPRMSTTQRDQLVRKLTDDANNGLETTGLVIYNTSNDCIEYWHGSSQKWRSLCGSLPPAKLDFIDGCGNNNIIPSSNMNVEGVGVPSWQQDRPFSSNLHTITIRVYVSQAGTYAIHADSGNGYFFSAEGIFQAEGNYNVILKGRGTPKVGYDQSGTGKKGDKVKFTFNGEESRKCKEGIEFKIIPAFLKLTLEKAVFQAEGKYYIRSNAKESTDNNLKIRFQLEVPGYVKITAINAALGLEFVGEKTYTGEDNLNQVMVLYPIEGKSIPSKNDLDSYDLTLDVNVRVVDREETLNNATAKITIEPTSVAVQHASINFGSKAFYENSTLDPLSEVIVPVKVVGSGNTKMTLTNSEGVQFASEELVLNLSADETKVVPVKFKPIVNGKKMPKGTSSVFTLDGSGRFVVDGDSKVTFKLERKPVGYTIDCTKIRGNRTVIPYNKPIGENYYIIVPVNVTEVGEYEINTTGLADGISFSSTRADGVKLEFEKTGPFDVKLYAIDEHKDIKPQSKNQWFPVGIVTNDGSDNKGCTEFKVKVGFNDLKVLYYYTSSGISSDPYIKEFIEKGTYNNGKNFGSEGKLVETGNVSFVTYLAGYQSSSNDVKTQADRNLLAKEIKEDKYNLIIIDGTLASKSFDKVLYDAFKGYIEKDGLLFFGFMSTERALTTDKSIFNSAYTNIFSWGESKIKTRLAFDMLRDLNNGKDLMMGNTALSANRTGRVLKTPEVIDLVEGYLPLTNTSNAAYFSEDTNPSSYVSAVTTGTNYIPIMAYEGNIDKAFMYRHKQYKNFVIGMGITEPANRAVYVNVFDKDTGNYVGTPNNTSDYHKVLANILYNMINKAVNQ